MTRRRGQQRRAGRSACLHPVNRRRRHAHAPASTLSAICDHDCQTNSPTCEAHAEMGRGARGSSRGWRSSPPPHAKWSQPRARARSATAPCRRRRSCACRSTAAPPTRARRGGTTRGTCARRGTPWTAASPRARRCGGRRRRSQSQGTPPARRRGRAPRPRWAVGESSENGGSAARARALATRTTLFAAVAGSLEECAAPMLQLPIEAGEQVLRNQMRATNT